MWLCMWKLTISEEILIWFLDYFNIFALCEQLWKIRILGPLLRQKGSPLGPLFAKNWVPFGSPFYNFWVPLRFGNSDIACDVLKVSKVLRLHFPGVRRRPPWEAGKRGGRAEWLHRAAHQEAQRGRGLQSSAHQGQVAFSGHNKKLGRLFCNKLR